jgi:hypothetical protein
MLEEAWDRNKAGRALFLSLKIGFFSETPLLANIGKASVCPQREEIQRKSKGKKHAHFV